MIVRRGTVQLCRDVARRCPPFSIGQARSSLPLAATRTFSVTPDGKALLSRAPTSRNTPLAHAFSAVNLASHQVRTVSTISHVAASADASREVPTPLILVSASKWTKEPASSESLKAFEQHFTRHGWNVTHIDVEAEAESTVDAKSSEEVLAKLEAELAVQIRKAAAGGNGAPFPPIMVAQGLATLIVEQYVSSNPLSGLVLLDPPLTPLKAHEDHPSLLPTPLEPFTYEIRFPTRCAWTAEGSQKLMYWDVHRIEEAREDEADEALERFVWDIKNAGDDHGAGPHEIRKWAEDECGISDAPFDESSRRAAKREKARTEQAGDHDHQAHAGASSRGKAPERPEWYATGMYARNAGNRKKEPLILDESHIEEAYIRGSGPGGQAINKNQTCVQLKHTPTGIVIKCQKYRILQRNRVEARRRLSREIELIVFGERDSVLGRQVIMTRQRKLAKSRKQARRERERLVREPSNKDGED